MSRKARYTTDVELVFERLTRFHGIERNLASDRLHQIKRLHGLGSDEEVIFDYTGNVYDQLTADHLGSLTQGGAPPRAT
jgi:hypothetical protein